MDVMINSWKFLKEISVKTSAEGAESSSEGGWGQVSWIFTGGLGGTLPWVTTEIPYHLEKSCEKS